jgi:nitroreductase
MDALAALLGRHSVAPAFLAGPGPDEAALERILAAGASAPDHGRLRPWRFVVVRGAARERLGEVFAEALRRRDPAANAAALEQERQRPLRAPVVIALAARIDPEHPKIPEVEQILSSGAAAQNILLAAHAQGFGAKWLTGANAYDRHVQAALGLGANERLLGFIHIGSIDGEPPRVPHADARELTREWRGPPLPS